MSLVYFSLGTLRFWLDCEWGNSFLSQKALLVLGGLQPVVEAEVLPCEGHGLQWLEKTQGREGKKEKRERISLLVLTRYRLLTRNISAGKSITILTQLALCWWCVHQISCLEIWGLCSSVLSPKPLCAHHTQMLQYPSPGSLNAVFSSPQYFKVFIWKRLFIKYFSLNKPESYLAAAKLWEN